MSVSIGVHQLCESDGGLADIVRKADEALYQAKRDGKNRVESRAA
ncbi:MAG: diguanylate cyclase [Candidatus Edwardsbacteria bacterium]|nr:diguanylate cyclase [Candidatus Edwardsbacteria bacterium]